MTCDDIQLKLNDYVDKELSIQANEHIEEHLKVCKKCQNKSVALIEVKQSINSLEPPLLSKGFDGTFAGKQAQVMSKNSVWPSMLPIAASVLLLVPILVDMSYKPERNIQNDYAKELKALEEPTTIMSDEYFLKWTQSKEESICFNCGNFTLAKNAGLSSKNSS